MHFVIHQVMQFHHVDEADGDWLLEAVTGAAIVKERLAAFGNAGFLEAAAELAFSSSVEDRSDSLETQALGSPTQVGLQDLPDVHAAGHSQGVEQDIHGRAVGEVGHIFFRQDFGNDALVAMPAGHLVADRYLPLGRDVHFDHLLDAALQLVAPLERVELPFFFVK